MQEVLRIKLKQVQNFDLCNKLDQPSLANKIFTCQRSSHSREYRGKCLGQQSEAFTLPQFYFHVTQFSLFLVIHVKYQIAIPMSAKLHYFLELKCFVLIRYRCLRWPLHYNTIFLMPHSEQTKGLYAGSLFLGIATSLPWQDLDLFIQILVVVALSRKRQK